MKNVLVIECLDFSYSSKQVLNNINLSVEENDILVLLGPNGAGKTTLLKCILGLIDYESGKIQYFDKELSQYTKSQLAKTVCFVPQLSAINNDFLARDYIAMACTPYLRFYETPGKEIYVKIDEIAEELDASELMNRSMRSLSGGEQQLVSIIKALVQNSPIIVLDEPTSALDYGNQGKFLEYVKNLKLRGKTIIMSSHNPNHALMLDSKICVLKNQTIEYFGNANEIISERMLSDVYGGNYELIEGKDKRKHCVWKL